MRTIVKILPTLLVALGIAFAAPEAASAATAKKKPVASKQVAKHKTRVVRKKPSTRHVKHHVPRALTEPQALVLEESGTGGLHLASSAVTVIDQGTGDVLYEKNAAAVVPIASISKLMTAMVALDAKPNLEQILTISAADVDTIKGTRSRLQVGTRLSREEMLRLALMSSENRAASALSRNYPGGQTAFIAAMNAKAKALGLKETHFSDPTGLTPENVSSARDLAKMVAAAHQYPLIRDYSTSEEYQVAVKGREQTFHNTNVLVKNDDWTIGLSKTGYISEAGRCLVMQAWFNNKPTIIVLLDSWGKLTRIGDAQRIRHWIESLASAHSSIKS